MNRFMMLAAGAALGCVTVPAMATMAAMPTIVLGDDVTEGYYMSADVHYRVGSEPRSVGSFSGTFWDIAGFGVVFQVCAERHAEDEIADFYTVTSGISIFGDFRDGQLNALFSNAMPLLNSAAASYLAVNGSLDWSSDHPDELQALAQYSVALQAMTWIIIDNDNMTIRPTDPSTPFGIVGNDEGQPDGMGDPITASYIMNWAENINNGAWMPQDGVTLYYAASSNGAYQDRFWAEVTNAVPEPASWAMMIGGFAFIGASMRRRKPVALAA